jgi:hypothetical protein
MAVIMMNSLSQSLVNNPYYVSVTPIPKKENTAVTPTQQSNTYLTQQHNQTLSLRYADMENNSIASMSTHELKHVVITAAQDKVNESSANIQSQKESLWQLGVQQQYIDSQKAALNAYVVSATGESTDERNNSLMSNEGLTDKYMSLVEQEMKLRVNDILKPEFPKKPIVPDEVYIQPVPGSISQLANQQVINHYNNVQHQGRSSLLHLSA